MPHHSTVVAFPPSSGGGEERFRLITQLVSDVVWDWNLVTHHVWWNEGVTSLFGYTMDEMLSDPHWWRDHIHADDRDRVTESIHAAIADPATEIWEETYRFRTASGKDVQVIDRGRLLRDPSGKALRMLGAMKDLSRQAEQEARFQHLADSIPQVVWSAEADGTATYFNQHWYNYTGLTEAETLSKERWTKAYHPDDHALIAERWRHSLATGADFEVEFRIRSHDGQWRWFLCRGLPMFDQAGKPVRWSGTLTDIHDKNTVEHQLKQAIAQAETANLAKTEFLTNMSHEIRTPMNAVVGLANILHNSDGLTAKQREYVATLQVSAEQLLQLINDLLDVSRLESNSMHLEAIPFDLNQVVQDVVRINSVSAREKHITIAARGQCAQPLVGDPLRLKQVIMNLVGNAVKFTEEGAVTVNLFATSRRQTHMVDLMIAVEDTGIGIPPSKIADIFGKFAQAETSTSRRFGGSGLGLSIAKTLVELMGGQITVNSKPGKGSCFTVTLALPTMHEAKPNPLPLLKRKKAPMIAAQPAAQPGTKVLLVEDYHANVLVATMLLQNYGYEYELASSGEEALRKLEEQDFAAVLMDVQMPEMNGYQATAVIRERETARADGKRTTIIGMTAHALKGDRERCLDAGMDDYIAKPFRPETLKTVLEKYCQPTNLASSA